MNDETLTQRNIMIALSSYNCLVLRQQSGVLYDSKGQRVRVGFPGLSDLLVVRPDGQACFLEIKTDHKAFKRPEQIKFIDAMKKRGHRADFVTTVDEALAVVFGEENHEKI